MQPDIFKTIEHSKKVDFADILTKCVELFKKTWQQGAVHALIVMIAVIPFIAIVYGPILYYSEMQRSYDYYGNYVSNDPSVLMILLWVMVVLVMMLVLQAISAGIAAHFFKVCRTIDMGTQEETTDYFEFFKNGNLPKLLLFAVTSLGISLLAVLLCYLPILYAIVPLQLMVPIFAFNPNLSVSEIVKAAFKLGNKHWIYVFGFWIIASNVAQLGVFLCLVGIIFTASIVHLPVYYFYKDTIGFEPVSEDSVGQITS